MEYLHYYLYSKLRGESAAVNVFQKINLTSQHLSKVNVQCTDSPSLR